MQGRVPFAGTPVNPQTDERGEHGPGEVLFTPLPQQMWGGGCGSRSSPLAQTARQGYSWWMGSCVPTENSSAIS